MQNEVNIRLGRKRGPTAEAYRKVVLKVCDKLDEETGRQTERRPMTRTRRQLMASLELEEAR